MSNPNQAGKGDTPRPLNMVAFRKHYDEIFRNKSTTEQNALQAVDDPFESPDHDNDNDLYAERVGYP